MHYGKIHEADLGDGLGRKEEHFLARQSYFPVYGTCWESIRGGHHFRAWKQNGTEADTGAWFLAYVLLYLNAYTLFLAHYQLQTCQRFY